MKNVLIIGFGSIGKRHYNILLENKKIHSIDIVTKQTIQDITTFNNLKAVNLNKYQYIIIASETKKHFKQLKYIENNTKNKIILVEKPLYAKKQQLSIKNNKVYVAYNRRFYPIINKIKSLVLEDKCYYINVFTGQYLPHWRPDREYTKTYSAKKNGGGVLLDLSHEIDYINYLCGQMKIINSVNTKVSNLKINSDDLTVVTAKSKYNTLINFSIDYISKEFIQRIVIHLENSTIFANLSDMTLKQVFKDNSFIEIDYSKYSKNYSFEQMHKCIINNKIKKLCTYKEGMKIMKIIHNIKKVSNEK